MGGSRVGELDVDDGTDDLYDCADVHSQLPASAVRNHPIRSIDPIAMLTRPARRRCSMSSLVMLPCRSRLYSSFRLRTNSSALSVAFFIATMRALCSLALAFSSVK